MGWESGGSCSRDCEGRREDSGIVEEDRGVSKGREVSSGICPHKGFF